jgi:Domain of unknown function (DUF4124)
MKTIATALLGALLVLAPALGESAKVYKWTDNEGNVIYSDSPHPGAEAIEVPTEPAGIVPVPPEQIAPAKQPASVSGYGALVVASPSDGQILRDSSGAVNVSLAVEPPLRVSQGDAIRLKLDGQTLDTRYTGSEIAISSVPRGTHKLQAEVINPAGDVLVTSAVVTFHMHAPSAQAPTGPAIYPPTYRPVYPPQGSPKPAPAPR